MTDKERAAHLITALEQTHAEFRHTKLLSPYDAWGAHYVEFTDPDRSHTTLINWFRKAGARVNQSGYVLEDGQQTGRLFIIFGLLEM